MSKVEGEQAQYERQHCAQTDHLRFVKTDLMGCFLSLPTRSILWCATAQTETEYKEQAVPIHCAGCCP
eukprot:3443208-Karenia_brevis.AAC.1